MAAFRPGNTDVSPSPELILNHGNLEVPQKTWQNRVGVLVQF